MLCSPGCDVSLRTVPCSAPAPPGPVLQSRAGGGGRHRQRPTPGLSPPWVRQLRLLAPGFLPAWPSPLHAGPARRPSRGAGGAAPLGALAFAHLPSPAPAPRPSSWTVLRSRGPSWAGLQVTPVGGDNRPSSPKGQVGTKKSTKRENLRRRRPQSRSIHSQACLAAGGLREEGRKPVCRQGHGPEGSTNLTG